MFEDSPLKHEPAMRETVEPFVQDYSWCCPGPTVTEILETLASLRLDARVLESLPSCFGPCLFRRRINGFERQGTSLEMCFVQTDCVALANHVHQSMKSY
jgi:hypothetical protein